MNIITVTDDDGTVMERIVFPKGLPSELEGILSEGLRTYDSCHGCGSWYHQDDLNYEYLAPTPRLQGPLCPDCVKSV